MVQELRQKDEHNDNSARRMARLAAVQGLYQLALTDEQPEALIRRFRADPAVVLREEETVIAVDRDMFGTILSGVSENRAAIDEMIAGAVDAKLSPGRMEPLLKSILRAGVFELQHSAAATGVIVNDYVDVAHGFFGAKEPGLVNAVLDRLAKTLRS
ncbi:MAG: transcription antitermination factor NusB [Alphaproteobacteria bacterium]|nr:transcription antitermination factor NusB [Alphaproteobacteria bacterium]